MSFAIFLVFGLMFSHWFGDFVFQTRWMAENKSKNFNALLLHVLVYSINFLGFLLVREGMCLFYSTTPSLGIDRILIFVGVNAILHFFVDAVTSRISGYFWKEKNVYAFFVTIGFDQWLHLVSLAISGIFCFEKFMWV